MHLLIHLLHVWDVLESWIVLVFILESDALGLQLLKGVGSCEIWDSKQFGYVTVCFDPFDIYSAEWFTPHHECSKAHMLRRTLSPVCQTFAQAERQIWGINLLPWSSTLHPKYNSEHFLTKGVNLRRWSLNLKSPHVQQELSGWFTQCVGILI